MELRPYQRAAVEAVYRHLRERDDNPVVVIPTAGGKTPAIATICRDAVQRWNGRVLVVSHVKELLQQAVDKLRKVAPDLKVGVCSAGLNRRETDTPIIVAGIQSIFRRAAEIEPLDLVVIDECHLLPADGDGMYRTFLADAKALSPHLRIIGFTATPFRLDSGPLCTPDGFLNHICYEIGIRELLRDGYLCPLVTKAGVAKIDTGLLHIRGGEFVTEEVEQLVDQDSVVDAACAEIVAYTATRQACLIFASSVNHGRHVVRVLQEKHGIECGFVSGETPSSERDELLARFRHEPSNGLFPRTPLKYLCNVNVLTTGFDAPNIDCVVLLRPTASAGLFSQMVGRGCRLHPGKQNCLILDFGGNVLRHGPVDQLKIKDKKSTDMTAEPPAKECSHCHAVVATGYSRCPDCGHEFPPPNRKPHEPKAAENGILTGQSSHLAPRDEPVANRRRWWEAHLAERNGHTKWGASDDDPKSMRVDYKVGWKEFKSEWVCFEHAGFAGWKAQQWWKKRSQDPLPETAEQAVTLAESGALAGTRSITVRSVAGEPYERIIDYELGPLPEPLPVETVPVYADEDIPF